ncbi:glycosyltransferase [Geojedonia litorea]|uniref:Glycosyltransferase n=1 Tax=Geojedonia litorea TaxID=1268269 RepID=A0ABV9MZX0_9FLAO
MIFKICLLIEQLNRGGAERSAGLLSTILSKLGFEVVIITLYDDIVYPYTGELINLGKYKKGSRTVINKFLRYNKLKKTLQTNHFDLILDFRMKNYPLREFLLNKVVFKSKMVNMIRHFNLEWYLPNPTFLSKHLYRNYAGINSVSTTIQKEIEKKYNFKNVSTIHSPVDINYIVEQYKKEEVKFKEKFVIAVGRLDPIKQFDKLIEAYKNSILPEKNISLIILGNGPQKKMLNEIVNKLNLQENVRLIEFRENPFKYIRKAEFLILSSKGEGFPRVLLESLACETPVIAFDCKSGPSEIINHNQNGLLVENQNFTALTMAINELTTNSPLYDKLKANSLKSLEPFSMENISKLWKNYIEGLNL